MKSRGSQLALPRSSDPATARGWALPFAVAVVLLAGLARPGATMAAEGSDGPTEENQQAARQHFAQGDAAFKAGRYDEALKEFEAGYAVSRRAGFLLNMAHTERKLGHLREARTLYKKYLLVDANSKLRDEVRAVIGELDSALADEDLAERDRKRRGATSAGAGEDVAPTPAHPEPAAAPVPVATALPKAPAPETAQPVLVEQRVGSSPPDQELDSHPFYRRAWFWVAVGAVVLSGAGAAVYLAKRPGTDPFHDSGTLGSLGN